MMRRRLLNIVCLLALLMGQRLVAQDFTPTYMSQFDRIGVGVRGGMASHMQASPLPLGYEVMVDVQYAHYWRHDDWHEQFGILAGLSAGFSSSSYGRPIHEHSSYTVTENELTFPIEYTVDASLRERNRQIQLEIPVMFSMVMHCGWFLNVGPRLQIPVSGRYAQTISDDRVAATYSRWSDQPIFNMPTTGCFTESTRHAEGKWETPKVNLLVGGETGYEYMFNNKNRITAGVYGHCGVLPLTRSVDADARLVQIVPPTPEQAASVSTLGLTNTYGSRVNYFAVGVRIAYCFVW